MTYVIVMIQARQLSSWASRRFLVIAHRHIIVGSFGTLLLRYSWRLWVLEQFSGVYSTLSGYFQAFPPPSPPFPPSPLLFFSLVNSSFSAKCWTRGTAWTKNSKEFGLFSLRQTQWEWDRPDEANGGNGRQMEGREKNSWAKNRRAWRNSEGGMDKRSES